MEESGWSSAHSILNTRLLSRVPVGIFSFQAAHGAERWRWRFARGSRVPSSAHLALPCSASSRPCVALLQPQTPQVASTEL